MPAHLPPNSSTTSPTSSSPLFSTTPHAGPGGRRIRDGLRPLPPTPCPPAPLPGVLLARQPPCPEADTLSSGCAEHPARFREMRGACGAQEIAPVTQVGTQEIAPVAQVLDFHPQPPAPQNSTKASPTRVPPLVPPSNTPPHASSPSGVGGLNGLTPTAADPGGRTCFQRV